MVQYTDHNPETQLNTNINPQNMVQYNYTIPETQLNTNIIREPHKYNTMVQYTDHNPERQLNTNIIRKTDYNIITIPWYSTQITIQKHN